MASKKKKQQKPLLFIEILCIALIIFGCAVFIKIQRDRSRVQFQQTYSGTLPCADCSGIQTTLIISSPKQHSEEGTYTIEDVYQGKNVQPYTVSGTWTIDDNILSLHPDKSSDVTYFLISNPSTLQMLDNKKHEIDSPFPLSLFLKK